MKLRKRRRFKSVEELEDFFNEKDFVAGYIVVMMLLIFIRLIMFVLDLMVRPRILVCRKMLSAT
jgi:hypothetical protein